MNQTVVVGGGIASLYASIVLARQGMAVTVIEREPRVGGLLNSVQNEHGDWFDHGTHFIAGTNNPAIDEIVLPQTATARWRQWNNEHAGNVFNGSYSTSCLFVDTRSLPDDEYALGIRDYLNTARDTIDPANLEEQLEHRFGEAFAHSIFEPAMRKLYAVDSMTELTPDAHLLFGMKRLKMFDPAQTRTLKEDPHHDDRLCFHEFSEGSATRAQYYPYEGGSGEWITELVKAATEAGVEFRNGCVMTDLSVDDGRVTSVVLGDGERLECDLLVWTVPLFPLLRSLDIRAAGGPPTLRTTTLFHYVFDRPPVPDDCFYFDYDPAHLSFRATLYSNLQPEHADASGRHRITVETLTNGTLDVKKASDTIERELRELGTIEPEATTLAFMSNPVREGFPVLDHQFAAAKRAQIDAISGRLDNLVLGGRSCTDAWFMADVFNDLSSKLKALQPTSTASTPSV